MPEDESDSGEIQEMRRLMELETDGNEMAEMRRLTALLIDSTEMENLRNLDVSQEVESLRRQLGYPQEE